MILKMLFNHHNSLIKNIFRTTFISKKIGNLKANPGSRKKKVRLGRGEGSGRGNSSTRGMKGAGQRGTRPRIGFEGGQFEFYKMPPVMGRKPINALEYNKINLNKIEYFLKTGKLDNTKTITIGELAKVGIISSSKNGVILLGSGKETFNSKINIEVSKASLSAIEAIRKNGGTIKTVYMSPLILQKYYRYSKKNPLGNVKTFLSKIHIKDRSIILKLMKLCQVDSPVCFPPQKFMKIYYNYQLGGFMSYCNIKHDKFKFNNEVVRQLDSTISQR